MTTLLERRQTPEYNCAHFVADVFEQEAGQDVRHALLSFLARPNTRTATMRTVKPAFECLPAPRDPCVVLFRRAKATPHVGVYLRGRVFHLTPEGAIRQPLHVAELGYTSVRFYAVR